MMIQNFIYNSAFLYKGFALLIVLGGSNCYAQQKKLDSLDSVLKLEIDDTSRVLTLIAKAEELWRKDSLFASMDNLDYALSIAEKIPFNRGISLSLLHKGILAFKRSEYAQSDSLLQIAFTHCKNSCTALEIGLICHWIGTANYRLSRYDKSLEYFNKALHFREAIDDKKGLSYTYFNIANVYSDQEQYEIALRYHNKSLGYKVELKDERGIASSYNNMANIFYALGKNDQALENFRNAHEAFLQLNDQQGVAYSLGNIGRVLKSKGDLEQALINLNKAKQELLLINDKQALAEVYNELGDLYIALKNFTQSRENLLIGQQLASEIGAEDKLIVNYLLLSNLDSAGGDMISSYNWFKKYNSLHRKVYNARFKAELLQLENNFQVERRDKRIEFLNSKNELNEKLRKREETLYLTLVTLLLVLLLGLIFYLIQKNKTNRMLAVQKRQAEDLGIIKDKLFAMISHDLRSPLNNLNGILHLMNSKALSADESKMLFASVEKNTKYLSELLDNLLSWAKRNINGNVINKKDFRISEVLTRILNQFQSSADDKSISLVLESDTEIKVYADFDMVEIAIRNIVSNAIKFTNVGGVVRISLDQSGDKAVVAITDNGIGMNDEMMANLFSKSHISRHGTKNEKGAGIGLLMAKDFIQKNGGELRFISQLQNGTSFYVKIPLARGV